MPGGDLRSPAAKLRPDVTADVYDEHSICCNCSKHLSASVKALSEQKIRHYGLLPLNANPFDEDNLVITRSKGAFLCTVCLKEFQNFEVVFVNSVRRQGGKLNSLLDDGIKKSSKRRARGKSSAAVEWVNGKMINLRYTKEASLGPASKPDVSSCVVCNCCTSLEICNSVADSAELSSSEEEIEAGNRGSMYSTLTLQKKLENLSADKRVMVLLNTIQ